MAIDNVHAIRPRDVEKLLTRTMAAGRPAMIWGPPGIGKSELIEGIGKKTNRRVIDVRLLLMEPTDLKGIPYFNPETKTMKWAPPADLPTPGGPFQDAILFLDEIVSAPPSVQAAAYQLILNRKVGEYTLPDGVSMVCAGNRDSDKGVTYRMPSPLANRLVHIEMCVDFNDWQNWAINNKIHPEVVGFLTQHPHKLFNFDPKSPDKSFATPRSWVFVSQLLDDTLSDTLNSALVAGSVGSGLAIEFMQHRKFASKMTPPADILSGKSNTPGVNDLSALYTLTLSLCYLLKETHDKIGQDGFTEAEWTKSFDRYLKFMMDNFKPEMVMLGTKTAMQDFRLCPNQDNLAKMKSFAPFIAQYGKYVVIN